MNKKYYRTENRRRFYKEMHEKLDGRCMICKHQERLVVDHNRATGEMRGLLCYAHNAGLGMFQDDPYLLEQAAAYLKTNGYEQQTESAQREDKIDHEHILQLLKDNPGRSQRSISRDYAKTVGCSEACAQARVHRIAWKYGIPVSV